MTGDVDLLRIVRLLLPHSIDSIFDKTQPKINPTSTIVEVHLIVSWKKYNKMIKCKYKPCF